MKDQTLNILEWVSIPGERLGLGIKRMKIKHTETEYNSLAGAPSGSTLRTEE